MLGHPVVIQLTCRNKMRIRKVIFYISKSILCLLWRDVIPWHILMQFLMVKGCYDFQSNCSSCTHNCSFIHFNFAGSSSSHALELPGEIAPKSDFWSLCMQDLLKILRKTKDTLYHQLEYYFNYFVYLSNELLVPKIILKNWRNYFVRFFIQYL